MNDLVKIVSGKGKGLFAEVIKNFTTHGRKSVLVKTSETFPFDFFTKNPKFLRSITDGERLTTGN